MSSRTNKNKKAKKKATAVPSKSWSITPTITRVSGSTNELVMSWTNKSISNFSTFSYEIWYHLPGVGAGVLDTSGTTTQKSVAYSMKENATDVVFLVKAVAKQHTVTWKEENKDGKKEKKSTQVAYWTDSWKRATFRRNAYNAPVPTVSLDKTKLTASVANLNSNLLYVDFDIFQDNAYSIGLERVYPSTISGSHYAEINKDVALGHSYTVRCRVWASANGWSEWSDFSSSTGILPEAVPSLNDPEPLSSTSVRLSWGVANGATSYDVEYTDNIDNFDQGSPQSTSRETTSAIIEGLERGKRWYFRVRAARDSYKTPWTPDSKGPYPSIILGQKPAPPTTYALSNTVKVGDVASLYWVHNAPDGSVQVQGEVHLEIHTGSEVIKIDEVINNPNIGDDLRENENLSLRIDTTDQTDPKGDPHPNYWADKGVYFDSGMYIMWKVRTMGVTGEYGEYSVTRRLDILASPTLAMAFSPSGTVTSLPVTLELDAGPQSQNVLGYHIEVISNSNYQEVDVDGMGYQVVVGEKIYDQFIVTDARQYNHVLDPGNINLTSDASYTVNVTVSMDSGLTASASHTFTTSWSGFSDEAVPTAEFAPVTNNFSMRIKPFCYDSTDYDDGEEYDPEEEVEVPLLDDVTLSVYRITSENELVEISTGIPNNGIVTVVDPHPALVRPRYRIVATDEDTGEVIKSDIYAPEYAYSSGIVITWDEDWSNIETPPDLSEDDALDDDGYHGNILILPYNASISETHQVDKSLISYIGRKRPVGYYGTQLGETASWKAEFPRYDTSLDPNARDENNTLSLLRQLAIYQGDVYVRESNGSGYWASIDVQFDLSYNSLVVPVTFTVTRVEGGA